MGEQALCACLLAVATTLGANAGDLRVPADAKSKTVSDYAIEANRAADAGDYAASASAFELALCEVRGETREDQMQRAALSNALGVEYVRLGRYAEAEPLYATALSTWRQLLGPRHPNIAAALNNQAMIALAKGQYDVALRMHLEAEAIDEDVFGPMSLGVANDLNNLGVTYAKLRKYSAAEAAFRRCLKIADASDYPTKRLPEFLTNMASLMGLMRRFEEAEELNQRVLQLETASRGRSHPSVGFTLLHSADCAIHLKRYESAIARAKEALGILKARLGEKHPQIGSAYYIIGVGYEKQKRLDLAAPALANAVAVDNDVIVEPAARVAHLREYESVLRATGRKDEANATARTADDLEREDPNRARHKATVDIKELGSFRVSE